LHEGRKSSQIARNDKRVWVWRPWKKKRSKKTRRRIARSREKGTLGKTKKTQEVGEGEKAAHPPGGRSRDPGQEIGGGKK